MPNPAPLQVAGQAPEGREHGAASPSSVSSGGSARSPSRRLSTSGKDIVDEMMDIHSKTSPKARRSSVDEKANDGSDADSENLAEDIEYQRLLNDQITIIQCMWKGATGAVVISPSILCFVDQANPSVRLWQCPVQSLISAHILDRHEAKTSAPVKLHKKAVLDADVQRLQARAQAAEEGAHAMAKGSISDILEAEEKRIVNAPTQVSSLSKAADETPSAEAKSSALQSRSLRLVYAGATSTKTSALPSPAGHWVLAPFVNECVLDFFDPDDSLDALLIVMQLLQESWTQQCLNFKFFSPQAALPFAALKDEQSFDCGIFVLGPKGILVLDLKTSKRQESSASFSSRGLIDWGSMHDLKQMDGNDWGLHLSLTSQGAKAAGWRKQTPVFFNTIHDKIVFISRCQQLFHTTTAGYLSPKLFAEQFISDKPVQVPDVTGDSAISMLKTGLPILKLGRRGEPHLRIIKLSDDNQTLIWNEKKPGDSCLQVSSIVNVECGQTTPVFARFLPAIEHLASLSTIVSTSDRTLDVVAPAVYVHNIWVKAVCKLAKIEKH